MDAVRQEFWGDLQIDLWVQNTAVYLANQDLKSLITTTGYKAHKPILSHPNGGTYTPHSDITFGSKTATKQTLTVSTFEYEAEDIDVTEQGQTKYDLLQHSLQSIRRGLSNRVEQIFLSQITNAAQQISGAPVAVSSSNIVSIFREAGAKLGAFDVPANTAMRAAVFGPTTTSYLREFKANRETPLGDTTLQNGVIGPWMGWTVVENNNLPYSAVLTMATNPADGDTVTIAGVTFEFQDDLNDVATGNVGVLRDGSTVDTTRAALAACINDSGTAGTTYVQMAAVPNFIIRKKRKITATNNNSADTLTITGFGDISVSADMTTAANAWGSQYQYSVLMMRGAIDLVVQFFDIQTTKKQAGFADLTKGLLGIGANTFDDGARLMVYLKQDASGF